MTAEQLKTLRKKLEMTQEELAVKLGCVAITIRRWEAGTPNLDRLQLRELARLAKKAGI